MKSVLYSMKSLVLKRIWCIYSRYVYTTRKCHKELSNIQVEREAFSSRSTYEQHRLLSEVLGSKYGLVTKEMKMVQRTKVIKDKG